MKFLQLLVGTRSYWRRHDSQEQCEHRKYMSFTSVRNIKHLQEFCVMLSVDVCVHLDTDLC